MEWTKKLTQLNDALADLVPTHFGIEKYIRNAGIRVHKVAFNGNAEDIWNSALSEALKVGKVDDLIAELLKSYPKNPFLLSAADNKEIVYALSPDIDQVSHWKPIEEETLEVLTYGTSTFLPIHFLEKGVKKSKAVAKIEITRGVNVEVGTGFLFQIAGSEKTYFMTNYHVINDQKYIKNTKVIFDYELDIEGNSVQSVSFDIDETGSWHTSPVHELDLTVCQLKDPSGKLPSFGYLPLQSIEVGKNEFVNIVQHPGGQMKKISVYHNIVTNVDNRIIQYLTDTLKGSSGAPVLNTNWEVVALHHSGGSQKTGEPLLPYNLKSRNEGININLIVEHLQKKLKDN